MEIWIIITIIVATTQTLRSAGQKNEIRAVGILGPAIFDFPMRCLLLPLALAVDADNRTKPAPKPQMFWIWVSIGGLMQVIFTVLLITLFNHRNFAAGTAFSKLKFFRLLFLALIIGEIVNFRWTGNWYWRVGNPDAVLSQI